MAIDNRIVSSNISKLRNHRGMTQFQLAAALNVSHQAVSKWETGAAIPDIQTLLALTQLFGVTMEELLNTEIVIREEDNKEESAENNTSASEETFFPGFLNDIIPEEAKKALKSAAGEVRKTFIGVSENLSARAEKTFGKATEFAEKAKSDIENRFREAKSARAQAEQPKTETASSEKKAGESEAKPRSSVSFEQLSRMAPFMSREKLAELVMRCAGEIDLESIVQIAPFLSRATVQKLIEKCGPVKADSQIIRRLAPFAGADALYRLIYSNLDALDWKTLEGLAPFLKRPMVDALAEYIVSGVKPDQPCENPEPQSGRETFREALEGMMDEIGNVVNEIGSAAKSIFTPVREKPDVKREDEAPVEPAEAEKPEAPEAPVVPDFPSVEEIEKHIPSMEETEKFIPTMEETEKFIPAMEETEKFIPSPEEEQKEAPAPDDSLETAVRRALELGNWSFVKEQVNKITEPRLLLDIALAAVTEVAQSDSTIIVMKVIFRLTEENKKRLFEKVAAENAWELAVAIQTYATEETAGIIIEKAAGAEGACREDAYLAVECYAKIAPKEILEKITEKAVSEDNWVLINALADAY